MMSFLETAVGRAAKNNHQRGEHIARILAEAVLRCLLLQMMIMALVGGASD